MRSSKLPKSQKTAQLRSLKPDFSKALKRVGQEPLSRGKWLLAFAQLDLSELTPGEWFDWQCEFAVFCFETPPWTLLPERYVRQQQQWLRTGIEQLEKGKEWLIDAKPQYILKALPTRISLRRSCSEIWDQKVLDTLVAITERCSLCEECHHLFVSNRHQAYCSPRCSQKTRTRRFRQISTRKKPGQKKR